jgi:hypothetical protein
VLAGRVLAGRVLAGRVLAGRVLAGWVLPGHLHGTLAHHSHASNAIALSKVVEQMRKYKALQSPYNAKYGGSTFCAAAWWEQLQTSDNADLVRLAMTLATVVPSEAATEREFSSMGLIHSKLRNRMSVGTMSQVARIKSWHTRNRPKITRSSRQE